jgi:predicted enzyme related to lactoylglutathione lyase
MERSTLRYLEPHDRESFAVFARRAKERSMATAESHPAVQLVDGVDFIALPAEDLQAALEFYGDTLGLRRSVYLRDRGYAEFETGNLTLSLVDPHAMGLELQTNRNAIALHVPDVHEARSALERQGVSFSGDTLDTGVCHMAFFADPQGNALMLHHRYAPRRTEG